jgi:hypothetical protein
MMKFNTDRIVSLTAIVVGVGSLFIIVYQTHLIRQSQHASALPYLMIAINANDAGVHLTLSNSGVGPALIEDIRILSRGTEFQGDPHDFYISLRPGADSAISINKIMPGRLIPAGASLGMFGLDPERAKGEHGGKFVAELLHLFEVAEVARTWYASVGAAGTEKAVIQITYASVYGDRWRLRSDNLVPERL